jgi:tRNA(Ile)-lysidine synthase
VSTANDRTPLPAAEARSLFADLADHPVLVLAVSGGPDSTALLLLAARWRKARKSGPKLVAVTVDHGLRAEARREAAAVGRLARSLEVAHRTLHWTGRKPRTGLQAAARLARYRLLAEAAKAAGAHHVLTAHTLDDQAETVLIRLMRGSGLGGLAAMARMSRLPTVSDADVLLVRPLLDVPKARLIATLRRAGIGFADDRSNRDPRFTRARLRTVMPVLEREGLSPRRLALLARRMRRADTALEAAVAEACATLAPGPWAEQGPVAFPVGSYAELPAEVALRLLGRAVARVGNEGPVELGKLEALYDDLVRNGGDARFRRTLAGALVTRTDGRLTVERAPARRGAASKRP